MMKFIDEVLTGFRSSFRREATFKWFVVIVAGLLVRTDHQGVTSIIRGLMLVPNYMCLINYFRSRAWDLRSLTAKWCELVWLHAPLVKHGEAVVMVGDGVKESKEGRKMPGVKRLHQESEDSSKAPYIWGHLFGGVGILAERSGKCFCLPLALRIQDGVKAIFGWGKEGERQGTHVTEIIRLAQETAKRFGKAILLLDRLYLSVPALLTLDAGNAAGVLIHIVTKAKCNCTAYREPKPKTGKRGRPQVKGEKLKVLELFSTEKDLFQCAEVLLYGRLEQVRHHCLDLLWGQKLYKKLRFVLVEYDGKRTVLVSTDLAMDPLDVIKLYGKRFCIESMFREMKQVVFSFCYRFWSKSMPKLNRFRKKTDPDPLEQVAGQRDRNRIGLTLKAIEGFVFCAIVATGLLQLIALRFSGTDELSNLRFLRTRRKTVASEATVADFLQRHFLRLLLVFPDLTISKIISAKQSADIDPTDLDISA